MQSSAKIVPSLSVALLTLLSALPWGLPPEMRFVLPLIPVVGIHAWMMRGDKLTEWFVFLCGLLFDVLTSGPLGFWSAMYLIGFALSAMLASEARRVRLGGWASLVAVVSCLAVAEWVVSCIYYFDFTDWRPLAVGALAAALAYPPLALLAGLLDTTAGKSHLASPGEMSR